MVILLVILIVLVLVVCCTTVQSNNNVSGTPSTYELARQKNRDESKELYYKYKEKYDECIEKLNGKIEELNDEALHDEYSKEESEKEEYIRILKEQALDKNRYDDDMNGALADFKKVLSIPKVVN